MIDHFGLTSHANPTLVVDGIDRIDDLETVMLPMNPSSTEKMTPSTTTVRP